MSGSFSIVKANYGGVADNVVLGNYVGIDVTGTTAIPNGGGIRVVDATSTTIGGTTPGAGNLISGNTGNGLSLEGEGNTAQGNRIGTNAAGTAPLGNTGTGLRISAAANHVGGVTPEAMNLISGNGTGVVVIGGDGNVSGVVA